MCLPGDDGTEPRHRILRAELIRTGLAYGSTVRCVPFKAVPDRGGFFCLDQADTKKAARTAQPCSDRFRELRLRPSRYPGRRAARYLRASVHGRPAPRPSSIAAAQLREYASWILRFV